MHGWMKFDKVWMIKKVGPRKARQVRISRTTFSILFCHSVENRLWCKKDWRKRCYVMYRFGGSWVIWCFTPLSRAIQFCQDFRFNLMIYTINRFGLADAPYNRLLIPYPPHSTFISVGYLILRTIDFIVLPQFACSKWTLVAYNQIKTHISWRHMLSIFFLIW